MEIKKEMHEKKVNKKMMKINFLLLFDWVYLIHWINKKIQMDSVRIFFNVYQLVKNLENMMEKIFLIGKYLSYLEIL